MVQETWMQAKVLTLCFHRISGFTGSCFIVKQLLELLESFLSCQYSGLDEHRFLWTAFERSSDLLVLSLSQSLARSLSAVGESGGGSGVSDLSAFSSASVNPSGSRSSAALVTLSRFG